MPSSGVFVLPQMTKPASMKRWVSSWVTRGAVVAGEGEALAERRARQLGPEVLQEERHAAEGAVGQRAGRLGTGAVVELVDDRVQLAG